MNKIKSTICALIICMSVPIVASATLINSGALNYVGGQNSSIVYSEIWDNMTSYRGTVEDKVNYGVIAKVKVGATTTTSQWRLGYAYKQANRVWNANETSYYDYEQHTAAYTSSSWGQTY
jgi:hypothetical protein